MVPDVDFDPILTELWAWEGKKPNLGKCSKRICFCKILLKFLAVFCQPNLKKVLKNHLTIFLWFLAFENCPWSSEYNKIYDSDSKFKFYFKMKAFNFWTWSYSEFKIKFLFCFCSNELFLILIIKDSLETSEPEEKGQHEFNWDFTFSMG